MTKTPQFDKALDEYFAKLELDEKGGQWRVCRFSGEKFYVRPEDIEFYKRIRVPLPTLEPNERRRKRCATHNSYTLFKKVSDYSGKRIISIYPPSSPFKVYEHQIWYSDQWDPLEYARNYNLGESIFKQLYELQISVPHPSLVSDPTNVNSDFTNVSKNLKNCYFTFDQNGGEDLYYHQCCSADKNCIECWAIDFSDTCYECKIGGHLFKCFWCEETSSTTESYFLWNCRNCDHCFMSSNLRNKKYYFRNKYVGKEEYEEKLREVRFSNYGVLQKLKQEFHEMKMIAPRKEHNNEKSINAFGDYIKNSKDIYFGLWVGNSENLSYAEGVINSRDSYDLLGGDNNELCYELVNIWEEDDFGCKFSMLVDNCQDVELCDSCRNCRNCFGCVGLKNKEFCIFNTQYTEEEYWKAVDEVKTKMLADGEYGEFFPPQYLQFPYKTTQVGYYYGFEDFDNAKKYGYDTSPVEEITDDISGEIVNSEDLPRDIKDVHDDILQKIIYDDKNKKKFRFIKQEVDFYRKYNIPLPRENPASRMTSWRKDFGLVVNFYKRNCTHCGKEVETSYASNRPEKNIWCEACYLSAIG